MIIINKLASEEQKEKGFATYKSFPHIYGKNGEKLVNKITGKPYDLIIDIDDDNNITVETTIKDKSELTARINKFVQNRVEVAYLLGLKEIAEKWKKAAINTGIIKA